MNTKNNVEVRVVVNDRPVKEFAHEGKIFVEAKDASEYTVKIKNNNPFRILAIVSVDGINILSGKSATHEDEGYVINGFSSYEVKGYRKSMEEVGAFKFVKKDGAYAKNQTGESKNCGIISVAIVAEKAKNQSYDNFWKELYEMEKNKPKDKEYVPYPVDPNLPWGTPYWWRLNPSYGTCNTRANDNPSDIQSCTATTVGDNVNVTLTSNITSPNQFSVQNSAKVQPGFDVGSTWGKKVEDKVINVEFERGVILGQIDIFYASKDSLKKLGIETENEAKINYPRGFKDGFCSPPSGWVS